MYVGKMHGKGTYAPADQDQPPRTGYWCMGEEIVGKSDDEAQVCAGVGVGVRVYAVRVTCVCLPVVCLSERWMMIMP